MPEAKTSTLFILPCYIHYHDHIKIIFQKTVWVITQWSGSLSHLTKWTCSKIQILPFVGTCASGLCATYWSDSGGQIFIFLCHSPEWIWKNLNQNSGVIWWQRRRHLDRCHIQKIQEATWTSDWLVTPISASKHLAKWPVDPPGQVISWTEKISALSALCFFWKHNVFL